jgi:hypothetical protein
MTGLDPAWLARTVTIALDEDLGPAPGRDVTTQSTIPPDAREARLSAVRSATRSTCTGPRSTARTSPRATRVPSGTRWSTDGTGRPSRAATWPTTSGTTTSPATTRS